MSDFIIDASIDARAESKGGPHGWHRALRYRLGKPTRKAAMKVFYSPEYVGADHAFDTTRKAKWIADSLIERPIPGVDVVAPAPITAEELKEVHSPEYVRAVQTGKPNGLATSSGFAWDPGVWEATTASTGGIVLAALKAYELGFNFGSLSSGLHHARRDHGSAFCTFNGLALAALTVKTLAKRVLILDLDAHCGGGTQSLIEGVNGITHVDISTSALDMHNGKRCKVISRPGNYLRSIRRQLFGLGNTYGICIYNAGMDPHEDCGCGGLKGITTAVIQAREHLVFEWCRRRGIPVAFTLAGGYTGGRMTQEKLVDLHRLTITAASL